MDNIHSQDFSRDHTDSQDRLYLEVLTHTVLALVLVLMQVVV
jgi:hypothetical protein